VYGAVSQHLSGAFLLSSSLADGGSRWRSDHTRPIQLPPLFVGAFLCSGAPVGKFPLLPFPLRVGSLLDLLLLPGPGGCSPPPPGFPLLLPFLYPFAFDFLLTLPLGLARVVVWIAWWLGDTLRCECFSGPGFVGVVCGHCWGIMFFSSVVTMQLPFRGCRPSPLIGLGFVRRPSVLIGLLRGIEPSFLFFPSAMSILPGLFLTPFFFIGRSDSRACCSVFAFPPPPSSFPCRASGNCCSTDFPLASPAHLSGSLVLPSSVQLD